MLSRRSSLFLAAFAVACLVLSVAQRATSQDKEILGNIAFTYPSEGIKLGGNGASAVTFNGPVFVAAYPISPELKKKYGDGTVGTIDLLPGTTPTLARGNLRLPEGTYEVHLTARVGNELRTAIKPMVIRGREDSYLFVDLGDVKVLRYGSGMTAQQMEAAILQLQQEVKALKAGARN